MIPNRLPLAPVQSLTPHTIRFSDSQWARISAVAAEWRLEPACFVRIMTMYALEDMSRSRWREAAAGKLPSIPKASLVAARPTGKQLKTGGGR